MLVMVDEEHWRPICIALQLFEGVKPLLALIPISNESSAFTN